MHSRLSVDIFMGQFARNCPLNFDFFKNLIYNIYTRSGELRTFFLSFLSDSPDRSGKCTWKSQERQSVGQVGIKHETSFNNRR
jgi:hypothetical protein